QRTAAAAAQGAFADEIAPISIKSKHGETRIDKDEHPRADSSIEGLAKLKPVFKKDGVVTAGNASGMVDGAAALVLTTEKEAAKRKWRILGRFVASSVVGCDPSIMGIGPVPAVKKLLAQTGKTLAD